MQILEVLWQRTPHLLFFRPRFRLGFEVLAPTWSSSELQRDGIPLTCLIDENLMSMAKLAEWCSLS